MNNAAGTAAARISRARIKDKMRLLYFSGIFLLLSYSPRLTRAGRFIVKNILLVDYLVYLRLKAGLILADKL